MMIWRGVGAFLGNGGRQWVKEDVLLSSIDSCIVLLSSTASWIVGVSNGSPCGMSFVLSTNFSLASLAHVVSKGTSKRETIMKTMKFNRYGASRTCCKGDWMVFTMMM
jgi:hypothetical protein